MAAGVSIPRGLCHTHWDRWRYSRENFAGPIKTPIQRYAPGRATLCSCPTPTPGVIRWFSTDDPYLDVDVEPKPGSAVQCRTCQMPIREFLST